MHEKSQLRYRNVRRSREFKLLSSSVIHFNILFVVPHTFLDIDEFFYFDQSQLHIASSFPQQLNCTTFSTDESEVIILHLFIRRVQLKCDGTR
jgi:hypothetical protein